MADDTLDLESLAAAKAAKYGIPKSWFISLVGKGEGGFKSPDATSPKGAEGPGQLMPKTAEAMGVDDPTNHEENLDGAAKYAGQMWRRYHGNAKLATAAYNAGPGNADKHGENWDAYPKPHETKPYVERVELPTADEVLESAKPLPTADEVLAGPKPGEPPKPFRKTPLQIARERDFGHTGVTTAPRGPVAAVAGQTAAYAHPMMEEGRRIEAERQRNPLSMLNPLQGAEEIGNTLGLITAPVAGAVMAGVNALEKRSGVDMGENWLRRVGDLATSLVPLGGGELGVEREVGQIAKELGITADEARVVAAERKVATAQGRPGVQPTERQIHAKADDFFRTRGVQLPAWENQGGLTGWITRTAKGNPITAPYVNRAVNDEVRRFTLDANRGAYNEALREVGATYGKDQPVGTEGIKTVGKTIGAIYDSNLPRIAAPAADLAPKIQALYERAESLGPEYGKEFDTFVGHEIGPQIKGGQLSGKAWRDSRSAASTESSRLERKAASDNGTPRDRQLSRIFADLRTTLNDSAMAHSDPAAVAEIQKADKAWAKFSILKKAATRSKKNGGVFSPDDLLQAVSSGQTEAFARGQAPLQDYARSYKLIDTRQPTVSPLRQMMGAGMGATLGFHGGAPGLLLGSLADAGTQTVTNRLASAALARHAARTPQNYLARVSRATSPLVTHRQVGLGVGGVNTLRAATGPEAQQP
jgi:hypothetical protein